MKLGMMSLTAAVTIVLFAACNKDNNNSSTTVSSMDSSFTTMAAMSNYAEISAAKLADSVSTDLNVLAFANRMIADHSHAQDSLQMIASQLHLYAPDSLNAEQAAIAAQLHTLSGRAFDSTYTFSEVAGHMKTITLLNNEAGNGTNSKLKQYVSTYLPAIEMHQMMADSLALKY